jgi:serine/threonine-protein kinase RsbW
MVFRRSSRSSVTSSATSVTPMVWTVISVGKARIADLDDDDAASTDEAIAASHPPVTFRLSQTWTVDASIELSALRAGVMDAITTSSPLSDAGLDVADSMVLVASELAANALRHGLPPTVVELFVDGDAFLIDVTDHDLGSRPYLAGARPAGDGGLGMHIARRLALVVGWYTTGTAKHVWAILPAPAAV